MRYIIALLLFLSNFNLFCSDNPAYKASLIPQILSKNAKAVIRTENTIIEVENNSAVEIHFIAITILNKNGYDHSIFDQLYNSYIKISDVNVKIFDTEGKKIKSYFGNDILDYSAINGYSLYEDNRQKYFDPQYRKYPFTVEISYKRKLKSLMFLSFWMPCNDYNVSVEKSKLTVIENEGATIRYYENNIPQTFKTIELNKTKSYSWEINNFSAFSKEDFEAPLEEFLPIVYLSPKTFEVDGIEGSFTSWQEFGKWIIKLNSKRDTLSPATVEKIKVLTTGLSEKQKIQILYEYMQKHTRYVSIQVGIGGWQPFDALTVDRLAYGDCKALSNYMYSLLKAVGISSYFTLISAGENAPHLLENFPSQFFNHAILTVPVEKDTLFLECTNPYLPYGQIGSFTDDRTALMITKNGGQLIHTKFYEPDQNFIYTKSYVSLNSKGSGIGNIKLLFGGVNFDNAKMLSIKSNDDIKKELYKELEISNFIINDFSFEQPDKSEPIILNSLNITIDNYATILEKKLIIPLNLANKLTEIPNITQDRKSDIVIRRPQTEIDTIVYKIPIGYKIENVPKVVSVSSSFATYSAICKITNENTIIYVRELSLNKGNYDVNESSKFREFYTKVSQADMAKLSIVKMN